MLSDVNKIQHELLPHKQTQSQVEEELPPQQGFLRRLGASPAMMHYNRLIIWMIIVNIAYVGLITQGAWQMGAMPLDDLLYNLQRGEMLRPDYTIDEFRQILTEGSITEVSGQEMTLDEEQAAADEEDE